MISHMKMKNYVLRSNRSCREAPRMRSPAPVTLRAVLCPQQRLRDAEGQSHGAGELGLRWVN
jgi:hypothetical protein